MNKEPARIISIITAFATAVLGLIAAFGLDVSDSQRNAIIGVIAPTVTMIVVAGELIRSQVTPTTKAEQKITEAFFKDPAIDDKPKL